MKRMNQTIQDIGGRFCTVKHTRKGKTRSYCAKIVRNTEQYMTIFDVNVGETRKMNKDAVTEIVSGETMFAL